MPFESYSDIDKNEPVSPRADGEYVTSSKAFGKILLYMGIGLLFTALVAVGVSAAFAGWLTNWTYDYAVFQNLGEAINANRTPFIVYFGAVIVSFIGILVTGVAMAVTVAKGKRSPWPPFIIYSTFMGILMSIFLVAGIDFLTIGEAFGISAAAFVIMGIIGFFSKRNLNFLVMVLLTGVIMLAIAGLVMGLLYWRNPGAYTVWSFVYTGAVLVLLLVMVAADTYNIKKIVSQGNATKNMCVYCAYVMYTHFINIFIRVLILLARIKRN